MASELVHHVVSADPNALSAVATVHNGIVMTTVIPRRADGRFELGEFPDQAELALANLRERLEAAGTGPQHLMHLTVYLTEIADWSAFNEVYVRHFPKPYPVRAVVGVKSLAMEGMRIEITATAARA